MRLSYIVVSLAAFFAVAGVAHAQLFEKTDTQREIELGRQAAREFELKTPLSKNTTMRERVKRIGESLVAAMPQKPYPYEFKVAADPAFNAFCLPGGFMYVNEALLTRLTDDAALAYVMGHEITHATHRHWANNLRKTSREAVLGMVFDIALKTDLGSQIVALRSIAYGRTQESDADTGGLELAWRAGYSPDGALIAIRAMQEEEEKSGNNTPAYLRSHPHPRDRFASVKELGTRLKTQQRPISSTILETVGVNEQIATLTGNIPVVSSKNNDWYPLSVGNSWTYRVEGKDGTTSQYTVRIVGALPGEKVTAYRAVTVLDSSNEIPFLLCSGESEVWRRNRPTDTRSQWKKEYGFDMDETVDATTFVRQNAESISLPCGIFTDTYQLQRKDDRYTKTLTFGRGIGLLQTICVENGITETLIAYKVVPTTTK